MRRGLGLATAALLLAMACAGSPGPTRAEYLASLDELCRKADSGSGSATLPDPADRAALRAYLIRVRGVARRQLGALRKLRRPEGDDAAIDRILSELAHELGVLETADLVEARGDRAAVAELLDRVVAAGRAADAAFTAYGAEGCRSFGG